MEHKTCTRCHRTRPIGEFPLKYDKAKPNARRSFCNTCENRRREASRVRRGIPQRPRRVPPPGQVCEVCGATDNLRWDHDHATRKFRGWLCHGCNCALGFARDNPATLRGLAAYLER
jgi:hypothetical protein